MGRSTDVRDVGLYTQRLSERLRILRDQQAALPSAILPLTLSIVRDLEESAEELSTAKEELEIQDEELALASRTLDTERVRFQRLFDLAPDPLLTTDAFGTIHEGNRAASRLLGLPRDLLHRKPLAAYVAAPSIPAFRAYLGRASRSDAAGGLELRLRSRSREETEITARATPISGPLGGGVELLWTLVPRAHAPSEQGTLLEEARFIAAAAARLNEHLEVRHVAETAAAMAAEFFQAYAWVDTLGEDGREWRTEATHPDPLRRSRLRAVSVDAEETASDFARRVTELPTFISVTPLPSEGGPQGALTLVGTSEAGAAPERRVEAQRAFCACLGAALGNARRFSQGLRDAEGAAAEAEGQKRAMAALSHEIRTPLHSILGYSLLLLDDVPEPLVPAARSYVTSIAAAARHLGSVVDDVLTLSRGDRAAGLLLANVEAAELVEECAAMFRDRIERVGIRLVLEVPEGIVLRTDRSKLRQVMTNLIGNGVKYTREGSVSVSVLAEKDTVTFRVKDTGPGIEPAEVSHIFEPFWRGASAERRHTEGAGLGLAVVQSLVARLGGRVEVETAPERGSSFRVVLPRVAPEPQ